eukprot:8834072-Alexandrium_andersonii.AAC.1
MGACLLWCLGAVCVGACVAGRLHCLPACVCVLVSLCACARVCSGGACLVVLACLLRLPAWCLCCGGVAACAKGG